MDATGDRKTYYICRVKSWSVQSADVVDQSALCLQLQTSLYTLHEGCDINCVCLCVRERELILPVCPTLDNVGLTLLSQLKLHRGLQVLFLTRGKKERAKRGTFYFRNSTLTGDLNFF